MGLITGLIIGLLVGWLFIPAPQFVVDGWTKLRIKMFG